MNRFRSLIAKWRCTLAHWLWPTIFDDLAQAYDDLAYARRREHVVRTELSEARSALSGFNPDAAKAGGPVPARFLGVTRYPGGTIREDALTFQELAVAGTGLTVALAEDGLDIKTRTNKPVARIQRVNEKLILTLP